jgi:hypothetical protein
VSFFCLLWVLVFYLLRRSLVGVSSSSGGVWALLLGSITAIIQFFLGYIINPEGFGLNRWLFGFFELVSLPVLIPFIICFLMLLFRGFSGEADFGNFALLWLIPIGAMRALTWSSFNDPIMLISIPLLWTALAAGISFFINWMMQSFRWYIAVASILCILILPFTAATSYWAFFSHQTLLGFGLLVVTNIPLVFSLLLRRG